MSPNIGVFREGEINGKPFRIFTFPSQTSIEATGSDEDYFLCPSLRLKVEKLKLKELGYSDDDKILPYNTPPSFPFTTPPYFPNIRRGVDQQVQSLLDSHANDKICKLPLLPLFWCNDKDPSYIQCSCGNRSGTGTDYYLCLTCDKMYHKECVEAPLEIKHPSYPFLSLQLYTIPRSNHWVSCLLCKYSEYYVAYYSPTYNISMHQTCLMKPIPILIDHPKRHSHSLTFFPKQNSLLCNVCGVVDPFSPTYICARCVFVVHQDCIYFPYVIKISRHKHRISFTSSSLGASACGVCRKKVDNDCGAYSCNECDGYFVHSRCALRRDLWDGKELEGVPEEPEVVVDPFKWIADGIILHFSHDHYLKLEISRVYDEDKLCQACVLPVYEGGYYSCVDECDFILHEECASTPLRNHHPLHARPLTLKVVTNTYEVGYGSEYGRFRCDACRRHSGGYVYEGPPGQEHFRLDLRCASISEPFNYEGHEHPLFLALTPKEEESAVCRICSDTGPDYFRRKLNCIECDYIICFECATLPYKAMYKHDKHLLTFREGREASEESGWCEICEVEMVYSRERGFYSCDEYCCTTLHVSCLLGREPYMKAGQTINVIRKDKVHVVRNGSMTRPFCYGSCDEDRCPHRVFFVKKNKTFCSSYCTIE